MKNLENILIGIYGTGTKTTARAETEKGALIGEGTSSTANFYLSVKQAWYAVYDSINKALSPAQITLNSKKHNFHVGLGIKNTELPEAAHEFLKMNNPFDTFLLKSDAYVACLGAHNGRDGAVIIIDEGIVGHVLQSNQCIKVGGWGFPHADTGSTAWLGLEAIRMTLQWQDGYIECTPLLKTVFDHFGNKLSNIVEWAMKATPKDFAAIAPIVLNHLQDRDKHATRLIHKSAHEAEKVYDLLLTKYCSDKLPCCLFGYLAPYLKYYVTTPLSKNLKQHEHDGTTGALIMLKTSLQSKKLAISQA